MRHRNKGRKLGRNPSHRRAMLRNLASSLFLSARSEEVNEAGEPYQDFDAPGFGRNEPKVRGRIITTIEKAKTVRPLVEKCITIARKALASKRAAEEFATTAERNSEAWRAWRGSDQWVKWNQAIAPQLAARRRCIQLLGNKFAVSILFDDIAERFEHRPGGYTRILRLATPRLGDAGTRALLEFVGENDRVSQRSERPSFGDDEAETPASAAAPAAAATEEAPAETEAEKPEGEA